MHVLISEGRVFRGGRALLFILERTGWWTVAPTLALPPFIRAVEAGYWLIAMNRTIFSKLLFPSQDISGTAVSMPDEIRAKLTLYVLALSSILTFAISWRFWTPYRTYPMVPFLPGLHLAATVSIAMLVMACVGLVVAAAPKTTTVGLSGFLLSTAILILEDQSRLQPYIYVEIVVAFGLLYHSIKGGELRSVRMALVFVYLWAGIQKLNIHYFDEVFPWVFFGPRAMHLLSFLQNYHLIFRGVALFSALLEIGACVLLTWPKTRNLGVLAVAAIHTIAFLLIGPVGLNYAPVVWPWNIALVAYVMILFWNHKGNILRVRDPAHAFVVVLFGLLPILNWFSLWDDYLSFHAFSGATMNGYMEIPMEEESALPMSARQGVHQHKLLFVEWSMNDTRASAYPAARVYRSVFRETCRIVPNAVLVILSKPEWPSGRTTSVREKCPEKR
jgi:hypothetical protein